MIELVKVFKRRQYQNLSHSLNFIEVNKKGCVLVVLSFLSMLSYNDSEVESFFFLVLCI